MIVLAITDGRRGVSELLRRMFQWRVHASWYAVALLLPITMSTAAAGLNILLGARPPSSQQLGTWPALAGTFALLLLVPGIGGAWEEPGWRGYLTPQLQGRHTGLTASLIVGVLWASWHVPLFVNGIVPWSDALTIIPIAIVFAWLFNASGGSVLILMLCHAMNNTMGWWRTMFLGADTTREDFVLLGLWCLVAVVVTALVGAERLGRGNVADESAPMSRRSLVIGGRPGTP